jgi:hypothetical protein
MGLWRLMGPRTRRRPEAIRRSALRRIEMTEKQCPWKRKLTVEEVREALLEMEAVGLVERRGDDGRWYLTDKGRQRGAAIVAGRRSRRRRG